MKRVTKQVREEAAMICAIAASNSGTESLVSILGEVLDVPPVIDTPSFQWALSHPAAGLAQAAFAEACERRGTGGSMRYWRESYAEGEAMLRTGWKP